MPELDHALRGLLAFAALISLLLGAGFFGSIWHDRGWPTRVVIVGLAVLGVYLFAGQIKAFNLGIPFDAFSAIGLVGYAILLTGFVAQWLREISKGR